MADAPRLDPRPARPLTTREIAKVLGSLIPGYLGIANLADTRDMLRVVRSTIATEDLMPLAVHTVPTEEHRTLARSIFAVAMGMRCWCGTDAVITALDWWIEDPRALEEAAVQLATFVQSMRGDHGLA